MPGAEQLAQHLNDGKTDSHSFEAVLAHIQEHYTQALNHGVSKEKLKPVADLVKQMGPALAKLKELDAQAEQLAQQSAQHDQEMPQPGAQ